MDEEMKSLHENDTWDLSDLLKIAENVTPNNQQRPCPVHRQMSSSTDNRWIITP